MRIEISVFTANEVADCIRLDMLLHMVHYQYMHAIGLLFDMSALLSLITQVTVCAYSFVGVTGMCSFDDRFIISIILYFSDA